jgi:organic hydroperoxide reductase OsmC/OhrA
MRTHRYAATILWTGDTGAGTSSPAGYSRDHTIRIPGKPELAGSSDPAFRGDAGRHNPEELLLAALSACHMLWYLHLAAAEGIVVRHYADDAEGTMEEDPDGGGRFTSVILHPRVGIERGDRGRAHALHELAHRRCFIASSVNFPVRVEPTELPPAGAP